MNDQFDHPQITCYHFVFQAASAMLAKLKDIPPESKEHIVDNVSNLYFQYTFFTREGLSGYNA